MSDLDTNGSGSSAGFFRLPRTGLYKRSADRVLFVVLVEQDDVKQRLVYADAPVVLDEAVLAEAVHEEADP